MIKSSLRTAVRELSCFSEEIEEKENVRPCRAGNLNLIRYFINSILDEST